jgi:hypothetical protein
MLECFNVKIERSKKRPKNQRMRAKSNEKIKERKKRLKIGASGEKLNDTITFF